jgi:hypothetical protein
MSVSEVTDTILHAVQIVAIVAGAGWAYFKFARGRTLKPRAELDVTGRVVSDGGHRAMLAKVTFKNEGLSWIQFERPAQKGVFVHELTAAQWPEPDRSVAWGDSVMRSLVLEDHDWVEPGETVSDEVLVPLGSGDDEPLAYCVIARVAVRQRRVLLRTVAGEQWAANVVVPGRLEPVGAAGPVPGGAADNGSAAARTTRA